MTDKGKGICELCLCYSELERYEEAEFLEGGVA